MATGRFLPPERRRGGAAQAVQLALQGLRRFREMQSQGFPGQPTTLGAPAALSQALSAPARPGAPPLARTAPVVAPASPTPIVPTGPAAPGQPAAAVPMPGVPRPQTDVERFLDFIAMLNPQLGAAAREGGRAALSLGQRRQNVVG